MPLMKPDRNEKAVKLMKGLLEALLEQIAGGPGAEDDEALGLEEELEQDGLEPEGDEDEFDEPSMDDEDFEPSEPSEARFEMEEEPSEPSEPSRMRSHRHKSRHALGGGEEGNPAPPPKKTPKPVRLDPEVPSRHSASEAGYPSPTTTVPSDVVEKKPKMSRHAKEEKPVSRFEKPKAKSRMVRDSERIAVSRYQREIDGLKATVGELQKAREDDRKTARKATMERHVIQLEGEGYILDRPRVVKRFMKCTDEKELQAEINDIRRYGKQSIVNQPMLPGGLFTDVGGGSPDRDHALTQQEYSSLDTDADGVEIIGSGVARFAMADDKAPNGRPIDAATSAVSRFRDSRKPSRGRSEDN